jgi:hypothetical protein
MLAVHSYKLQALPYLLQAIAGHVDNPSWLWTTPALQGCHAHGHVDNPRAAMAALGCGAEAGAEWQGGDSSTTSHFTVLLMPGHPTIVVHDIAGCFAPQSK